MDNPYLLEVENLSVEFHTPAGIVHAVSHVNFKLRKGEVLGIVGESGSGKSVTASALMRLLPDTAHVTGSIKLNGVEISSYSNRQFNTIRGKEIAMIFQDPMTCLNPLYTIGNQLEETLRLHMNLTGNALKKRAVELLDMVSIPQPETRLKQYPHEFSGGMRQRVMIAMALACNPSILIADEPTTALDVTIQAQILELMKDMQKRTGTAIIMITHDLGIVSDLCDRVNVMYGSRIMESGTVDDLFYRTAHPYTAGLLQCLPESAQNTQSKRLVPIEGSPVDLMMLPAGCAFAARCDKCMKCCLSKNPDMVEAGPGHTSRCWMTALENLKAEASA